MFNPNDIVECNDGVGRVIFHDKLTHLVHIMFQINKYTWQIQKCDEIYCRLAYVFLWSTESAFRCKYQTKQYTPILENEVHDHVMFLN